MVCRTNDDRIYTKGRKNLNITFLLNFGEILKYCGHSKLSVTEEYLKSEVAKDLLFYYLFSALTGTQIPLFNPRIIEKVCFLSQILRTSSRGSFNDIPMGQKTVSPSDSL